MKLSRSLRTSAAVAAALLTSADVAFSPSNVAFSLKIYIFSLTRCFLGLNMLPWQTTATAARLLHRSCSPDVIFEHQFFHTVMLMKKKKSCHVTLQICDLRVCQRIQWGCRKFRGDKHNRCSVPLSVMKQQHGDTALLCLLLENNDAPNKEWT